jgi:threonine synthase
LFDLGHWVADPAPAAGPWSLWRYRRALPVTDGWEELTLGEGTTPLVPAGPQAWYKVDSLMPTGSYKDRGSVELILGARASGARRVVADSSGNAGLSIATYAGRAGLAATVFVPEATTEGKIARLERTGAAVRLVPGDRQATALAALDALNTGSDFYASHVYNPLFHHGTKTFAYELFEQLGGRPPGTVILPVGNGTLLLGAAIGFSELVAAGMASGIPRLVAVQASACAPLAGAPAHSAGLAGAPAYRATVAEGIAIPAPPRLEQMAAAVRDSGGTVLTVDDAAIVAAQRSLIDQGIWVEPTAAVAAAAWAGRSFAPPVVIALTGRNA